MNPELLALLQALSTPTGALPAALRTGAEGGQALRERVEERPRGEAIRTNRQVLLDALRPAPTATLPTEPRLRQTTLPFEPLAGGESRVTQVPDEEQQNLLRRLLGLLR